MDSKSKSDAFTGDGASPGKIFIGGLSRDTTYATFNKHFGAYGEITDSVIMKDRLTGQPRGFGFITFADPSAVDKVMEDTHILNGKQVEIKRTIPRGAGQSKEFKTKKIFVGGIPSAFTEEEFRDFFSEYGKVVEHQLIRDHVTNRPRGFGFIIFDDEETVDEVLSKGNMFEMAGNKVEIKKAEPKKSSNLPPAPPFGSNPRALSFNDGYGGGFGGPYDAAFEGGYGPPGPYRSPGSYGSTFGGGYGYGYGYGGGSEELGGGPYGGFGVGSYRGESSLDGGYSSRFGRPPYGGGGYGGSGVGGYGRGGEGYGSYGGSVYGGGYESGPPGPGYGGAGGGYGRGGYSGGSRYHPYAR